MAVSRSAFADSRLRIQWAKESLADFERCARIYFRRISYELVAEPDSDAIHEHHKLRLGKPFPLTLTKYTVHVVEDLRAALDLAACDVARIANLSVDGVHFPFCQSATDFKSRINSACKGFPKGITDLFASYEPYTGGSELLFAINELCNRSKHKIIVPVASTVGTSLPYIETSSMTRPIRIMEGFASDEDEITFAITERGLQWKYHAKFSFGICFGKVGAIEGRDVRDNLDGMIRAVATIVDEIEAESRRLGLLT